MKVSVALVLSMAAATVYAAPVIKANELARENPVEKRYYGVYVPAAEDDEVYDMKTKRDGKSVKDQYYAVYIPPAEADEDYDMKTKREE
ncbi:hypothetical protein FQN49_000281 [Arthroderma sp. PD_2]|nr:hypothetical protein FQN49_000281 [Arthroderma sp. PD_2]